MGHGSQELATESSRLWVHYVPGINTTTLEPSGGSTLSSSDTVLVCQAGRSLDSRILRYMLLPTQSQDLGVKCLSESKAEKEPAGL